ncbi:MAG: hypothetical protein ACK4KU_14685, partial [Acinetobacter sp.]|uniref:hypothetical protein n=1 Tax=Acinetobacter sp. TaxID=472 RepID=UPI00391A3A4A
MAYFYNGAQIQTPFSITSNRNAFQVETLSLKQSTFLTEAQRWELQFSILMNDNEGDMFGAHTWDFHKKKTMVMPQLVGPKKRLTLTTNLVTSGAALGGALVVSATSTQSGILPAGYFIKFGNHDKIYAVKTDVSYTSNTRVLNLFPNLVTAVPAGTAVQIGNNAVLKYQLDLTSGQGITFNNGILSDVG